MIKPGDEVRVTKVNPVDGVLVFTLEPGSLIVVSGEKGFTTSRIVSVETHENGLMVSTQNSKYFVEPVK
jgi:hypothetical protein